MARRQPGNRRTAWYRKSWVWIVAAGVAILALAFWFSPYPVAQILTADGQQKWDYADAPARREIVWQPPETIDLPGVSLEKGSIIRPQLADRGLTLYFTLRDEEGFADIYQSKREGEQWSTPKPINALNSPADDIGPVLTADEQQLYIYSDREDSLGGFDLYVSQRTKKGWSKPANMGPTINTVAHEYDPAISADGESFFFASNRTARMQERSRNAVGKPPEWTQTLRARQGLVQFDLYRASRTDDAADWSPAEPLVELNREDSNEGAPFLAGGVFLYFASDRLEGTGDQRNYDLYRARLVGEQFVAVENLGAGVNTTANEIEPWISAEGFRLWFSSDRTTETGDPSDDDLYRLYASNAIEVYHESDWRQAALPIIYWGDVLFWAIVALLALAFLTALAWYLRQVSLRRAPIPAFFLIALLVHLFLGAGAFFVAVNEELMAPIRETLEEVVSFDYSEPLDSPTEPAAFEKTSDIPIKTDVAVSAPQRIESQVNELPPSRTFDLPMATPELSRSLPPEAKIEVAIPETTPDFSQPDLTRRTARVEVSAIEEPVETTPLKESTDRPPTIAETAIALKRAKPLIPTDAPEVEPPDTPAETSPKSEPLAVEVATSSPVSKPTEQPLLTRKRTTPTPTTPAETIEVAATEAVVAKDTDPQAAQPELTLSKRTPVTEFSPTAPVVKSSAAKPIIEAETIHFETPAIATPAAAPTANAVALTRTKPLFEPTAEPIQIETSENAAPAETSTTKSSIGETAVMLTKRNTTAIAPASNSDVIAPPETDTNLNAVAGAITTPTPVDAKLQPTTELPTLTLKRKPLELAGAPERIEVLQTDTTESTAESAKAQPNVVATSGIRLGKRTPKIEDAVAALSSPKPFDMSPAKPTGQPIKNIAAAESPVKLTNYEERPDLDVRSRKSIDLASSSIEQIETEAVPARSAIKPNLPISAAKIERARTEPSDPAETPTVKMEAINNPLTASPSKPLVELQKANASEPTAFDLPTAVAANTASIPPLNKLRRETPLSPYAEATIGLTSMFRLRRGDNKNDIIKAFGGGDDTIAAVRRGLQWLAKHQHEDGRFSLNKFHECCQDHKKCKGTGNINSDVAATGLALLPFLGDGHTHVEGEYQSVVRDGIAWLLAGQQKNGELTTGKEGNARMYSHGIAAITLCEVYGMTKDPALREPAQKAIDFIVWSQHEKSGGWRYQPHQAADTSVVGWQVMALKSGQMAELTVPQAVLDRTRKYLQSVEKKGKDRGQYYYQNRNQSSPAMTAEALLCLEYLGADKTDEGVKHSADYMLSRLPKRGKDTSYYWYYGTQALFHLQGEHWQEWNDSLKGMLLEEQIKEGNLAGTWNPKDRWETSAGRIYSTSLRLLMLEVYHRHLPLYSVGAK